MHPLPPLRPELAWHPGPESDDGSPTWTLRDPARQRFFRLGHEERILLDHWQADPQRLIEAARNAAGPWITQERLIALTRFLADNELLQTLDRDGVEKLTARALARQTGFWTWLLHHYLYLKIPLCHPDRMLDTLLPLARLLVGRKTLLALAIVGVAGILLTLRHWDFFLHSLPLTPTPAGALWLLTAFVASKLAHELGHALTARHFGCRVTSAGVALIVLWPVLYAEIGDAWRLASRRARLLVGAAGIMAETGLALLATTTWHFLPPGPARDACAMLAAVTWTTTLAINLNPLMRFDGYYLLADATGLANLAPRAFALASWQARRLLFGLADPPPETLPPSRHRFLLAFAWLAWAYRLLLFLGIALLVYHRFFKLAGIFLMAAELGWFVVRPVARFLYHTPWSRIRPAPALTRLLAGLAVIVPLLLVPWQDRLELPAMLEAGSHHRLHAPLPARVAEVYVHEGATVAAHAPLMRLEAPDLEHTRELATTRIRLLELELAQTLARPALLTMRPALESRLAEARSARLGATEQIERLTLTAPFAGTIRDLRTGLTPGRWLPRGAHLLTLLDPASAKVAAFVQEQELERLTPGARGLFRSNHDAGPARPVVVTLVERAALPRLPPHLASTHGGPIPARPDHNGEPVPDGAWYRLLLAPDPAGSPPWATMPGSVSLPARDSSLWNRLVTAMAAVWVRESGF
ncbi:MAG: HlyD family efflux transporter periplasmic adaptor subunit [Magnetococcales bacterium]|nr:HlyD family efflux transporter periplasmic adaptor subunit [Magnetococcales bacterium]